MILFMFYFVGSLHCKGPLLFYYLKVCTMKWQNQEMLGFHQEKLTVTQVQNSCEWVQLEEGWFRSTPRSKTIHGKANRLWNPPKTCFYTVNVAAIFTNFYHLCEGEVVPDLVQNEVHSFCDQKSCACMDYTIPLQYVLSIHIHVYIALQVIL